MNYSYIIIEDQQECVLKLQEELKNHPEFICKGIASTVQEGINITLKLKDNLIFISLFTYLATEVDYLVCKKTITGFYT